MDFNVGDKVIIVQDGDDVGAPVKGGDIGKIYERTQYSIVVLVEESSTDGIVGTTWYLSDYHMELYDEAVKEIGFDNLLEVLSVG